MKFVHHRNIERNKYSEANLKIGRRNDEFSRYWLLYNFPQIKRISIEQNMTGHDLKFAPK